MGTFSGLLILARNVEKKLYNLLITVRVPHMVDSLILKRTSLSVMCLLRGRPNKKIHRHTIVTIQTLFFFYWVFDPLIHCQNILNSAGRSSVSTSGSGSTRGLKVISPTLIPENRFFFYRRLFRGSRELSEDPMEIALLYGQAVYSVVELDEFPINDKVSLQLAGLQLQVILGDPDSSKILKNYANIF